MKADFKTGIKICSKCKEPKKLLDFSTDRKKSDGFDTCCKFCRKTMAKQRYKPVFRSKTIIPVLNKKQQKLDKYNQQLKSVWNNLNLSN